MKYLLLILILISFTGCYHQERDCKSFKTGTFEFTYTIDGIEKTSKFKRTEAYNIDYIGEKVDSASIRWINDCEFIQKSLHPKNMAEEKAIHFKIVSTTNDTYTFEYALAVKESNQKKRVERGVAKKIE
ncbi:MAG: hypothetical protein BM564_08010 [Bacteroidetes bacterium MedPE-SWsnd-G2]|nr:MAG: hypothetical protein BM564_08010 [Bacteroidetes bacterium MedPE-SWsnd-G2]